ncbi:hypothetical protein [Jannaschia rubra]|uniref:Uncharacterized protein n=1 Tax=Jannaschia rubra TaxID=282197 RepID=A0A0M6XRJ6_9RHOB|nr:hypothetical protein [Jannaschia rubra]CTQ33700.1 hypothetical protein JAN5088_02485 [Jannaschia rubra]SFG06894.1 hypothetical protein SAMN04488517_102533 [Jannaschia rubra]
MIRPEVARMLTRWREALIGALAVATGSVLWFSSSGLIALFGAVAFAVGAVLLLSGVRHALFHSAITAPGVVEVDEGRITYMGPILGGMVALDDITEITFRRTAQGEAFWRLSHIAGRPMVIPEGAAGADLLLDALAPLPGLDTGAMVRAVRGQGPATITVWRRRPLRALT